MFHVSQSLVLILGNSTGAFYLGTDDLLVLLPPLIDDSGFKSVVPISYDVS